MQQKQQQNQLAVPGRLLNAALMVAPERALELIQAKEGIFLPEVKGDARSIRKFTGVAAEVSYSEAGYAVVGGVGVIDISGGLIYKGYGWYWRTSYLDIQQQIRAAMADPNVKSILFDIDSPGGEVAGVFDLVDEIYSMRGTKPMTAVSNEDAFSAAYAIASAADKIYLSRTAQVGSIGVIAIHADQSGYDKELGVKYTPIYSGKHKNDYNPHEPLSGDVRASLQASVDKTYELFTNTVARNRGMAPEVVRNTEAAIFTGAEGVSTGLADAVRTFDQALAELIQTSSIRSDWYMDLKQVQEGLAILVVDSGEAVREMLAKFGFVSKADMPDIEKLKAESEAALLSAREAGIQEARAQAVELNELCTVSGVPAMAAEFIKTGTNMEAAKAAVLAAKAAEDAEKLIQSTVGPMGSGAINPLIADARRRAGV